MTSATTTTPSFAQSLHGDPLAGLKVRERIESLAEFWASQEPESNELGRVTQPAADAIKESGLARMLQPAKYGGYEAHLNDFMKAVMSIGAQAPSVGWVAGVVGVHPHELALADPRVQEELWGEDPDVWVASPYAPMGVGIPVEGGFRFTGHWRFSSGTDHCQWVMIGGFVGNPDGSPIRSDVRHFVLPRKDYEILQDSWQVMGLRGTGSKDLVVRDVFVPDYRVIAQDDILAGTAGKLRGLDNPLYALPRASVFSGAITAGTLGIAQSLVAEYIAWTRNRENRSGKASLDPFKLATLGESIADIEASVTHVLADIDRLYDITSAGKLVSLEMRFEVRRNQVRASRRAVDAADRLFMHGGGAALHLDQPLQQRWRDLHAAMNHASNVAEPVYQHAAMTLFGHELPPGARA
ncbi:acyl-CoA dehydrogenase family protein [Salinibacterium hongtaonis]|uniref:acyl-CoA dehydrogenase family protein n=1 Tax=Homoserinimonas hongtaonis TaxID=2079791 RepID=UPI000D3C37FD|nr:acyl-CoA dehydrogenase family protein [Salinibacterium hongtaonis]AWB90211.1 hydroxylase [Salinibacterium hongtaonis]